jgi:hypothetical protein
LLSVIVSLYERKLILTSPSEDPSFESNSL